MSYNWTEKNIGGIAISLVSWYFVPTEIILKYHTCIFTAIDAIENREPTWMNDV